MTSTIMDYRLCFLTFMSFSALNGSAYTPTGYIGCFEDKLSERILEKQLHSNTETNRGNECYIRCRSMDYRYAGTENAVECFCGLRVKSYQKAPGCNMTCPSNTNEYCGGYLRMSLYDTWTCARKPCKNNATCHDISATNYNCICNYGWGGLDCSKEMPTTTTTTTSKSEIISTFSKSSVEDLTTRSKLHKKKDNKPSRMMVYTLSSAGCVVALVLVFVVVVYCRRRHGQERRKQERNDDQAHIYNEADELQMKQGCNGYVNEIYTGELIHTAGKHQTSTEIKKLSDTQYDYVKGNDNAMYITPVYMTENEYTSIDLHSEKVHADEGYEMLNRKPICENEYEILHMDSK